MFNLWTVNPPLFSAWEKCSINCGRWSSNFFNVYQLILNFWGHWDVIFQLALTRENWFCVWKAVKMFGKWSSNSKLFKIWKVIINLWKEDPELLKSRFRTSKKKRLLDSKLWIPKLWTVLFSLRKADSWFCKQWSFYSFQHTEGDFLLSFQVIKREFKRVKKDLSTRMNL